MEPFRHIQLKTPGIELDGSCTRRVLAHYIDMADSAVIAACIDCAKAEGFTELYLMDRRFVTEALKEKLEHEASGKHGEWLEVVRCKDCKHRVKGSKMCAHPKAVGWDAIEPDDDDFCSCGERGEAETETKYPPCPDGARWKGAGMGYYYCSWCGLETSGTMRTCPRCKSEMDPPRRRFGE